jgi:hypothetical protein
VRQKNKPSIVLRQKRQRSKCVPHRPTGARKHTDPAGKDQQQGHGYFTRSAAAKQVAGVDAATATAQRGRRAVNSSA